MSVVALGSIKASPGVTTTSVALASVWPRDRQPVIVEADPDGGSLGTRFGLAADPGLVSLAAASRRAREAPDGDDPGGAEDHGERDGLIDGHTQELPGGVPVVVGPPAAEQAHAALATGGPSLVRDRNRRVDLLIDCGRLGPRSPSLPLASEADALVLVARPRLDEVHHLVHRVTALASQARHLCLVTIGTRPYEPREVAEAVQVPLLGAFPEDPRTARILGGHSGSGRRLARSPLLDAARRIAVDLVAHVQPREPVAAS